MVHTTWRDIFVRVKFLDTEQASEIQTSKITILCVLAATSIRFSMHVHILLNFNLLIIQCHRFTCHEESSRISGLYISIQVISQEEEASATCS